MASAFFSELHRRQQARIQREGAAVRRQFVYCAYDQLSHAMGPAAIDAPHPANADAWGAILIEAPAKAARRPYHQQKLALVLANQRHFALELEARGVAVEYIVTPGTYADGLRSFLDKRRHDQIDGPILTLRPAERELRQDLRPLLDEKLLRSLKHPGWLTDADDFVDAVGHHKRWRMDAFYRVVRQRSGLLMTDAGKPEGGRYSFDGENRDPWPHSPAAPSVPNFAPDAVTDEVVALIRREFAHHPGQVVPENLPTTQADADALWEWAKRDCMPNFGPFEDAMSTLSRGLFHTRISPLLNLHRLLPRQIVDDVVALNIPLNSKEGFVRQVLGWREFVHHVHEHTDGFRRWELTGQQPMVSAVGEGPGDGGYQRWVMATAPVDDDKPAKRFGLPDEAYGGALPNALDAQGDLPMAYWRGAGADERSATNHAIAPSGLHCLDHVVEGVWDEAYSHHITRLMVLSNIALLLDVNPRELTDWFWVAYADAYDWVVEPNVLAMGLFATGDLMTTKPYVAGSGYIQKMSDACDACAFNPKTNCPLRDLYWAFLDRHLDTLRTVERMRLPLAGLKKRSDQKRAEDKKIFDWVTSTLSGAKTLTPTGRKEAVSSPTQ